MCTLMPLAEIIYILNKDSTKKKQKLRTKQFNPIISGLLLVSIRNMDGTKPFIISDGSTFAIVNKAAK